MRVRGVWVVLLVTICCAVLTLARQASAQGSTGAIAGNVKDTTGAALPGVSVEVASPALIDYVQALMAASRAHSDVRPPRSSADARMTSTRQS